MDVQTYFPVLIFFMVALGLSTIIIMTSFIIAKRAPDTEKNAPYECGFEPFGYEPGKFDVRFYLVAILFIIFDLEIAFLFPWTLVLQKLGWIGFFSMILFLITLTIGFVYEWKKGALEWA
jgi:NADH-quinone oxidoreductase subunit A